MDRRFMAILAAIVIIFVGVFVIQNKNNGSTGGGGSSSAQPTNHVMGQNQKGVTLVEYGDYQCPICGEYYQPLKDVVTQYSTDIHFQFRNLPLSPNPHPNAFAAARAAEAADKQGKFWEMHDKLFVNQNEWAGASNPQTLYNSYAQQLGLDVNKFKQDYASSAVNDAINADTDAFAKTSKEKSTPTFFIDGKLLPLADLTDPQTGAPSATRIAAAIKAEIDSKTKQ